MKKQSSLYWICQIAGWFSYGLTILFFASILDKELNPIFYPRLAINLSIGILLTHLLRETMHRFSLRPPMPSNQWWKLVLLLFVFSISPFILSNAKFHCELSLNSLLVSPSF